MIGHERIGSGKRFRGLAAKLNKPGIKNPSALAASIGRKKYGDKRFQALALAGRRRAEEIKEKQGKPLPKRRVKV
jgi:hypothetical protein